MATEWEEILIAKGILPARKNDSIVDEEEIQFKNQDDDLDDELLADDDFLSRYTQKRAKELLTNRGNRFGTLEEISQPEYEKQVTLASQNSWVIVFLYQTFIPVCGIITRILQKLAEDHQSIKFVKIQATRYYPDKNVPTLIIYNQGNIITQLIGTLACGGENVSLVKLCNILSSVGVPFDASKEMDDSDSN